MERTIVASSCLLTDVCLRQLMHSSSLPGLQRIETVDDVFAVEVVAFPADGEIGDAQALDQPIGLMSGPDVSSRCPADPNKSTMKAPRLISRFRALV